MALVEAEDTTLERLREGELISCDAKGTLRRPNGVDSELVPPTPLGDAIASKQPICMSAYVAMSTKLDGRDKITKIMQYGARFFVWYFQNINPNKGLSESAFALYKTTQLSRKAFRMFKVMDEIVKVQAAITNPRFPEYKIILSAIRSALMGAFWTFDNLNYLTITKTINYGSARAMTGFSRTWAAASAINIFLGATSLHASRAKRDQLVKKWHTLKDKSLEFEEAVSLRETMRAANVDCFKNSLAILKGFMDLTCAINMPGIDAPFKVFGKKLNDGVIGVSGVISALTVLYNAWPDHAQVSPVVQPRKVVRFTEAAPETQCQLSEGEKTSL